MFRFSTRFFSLLWVSLVLLCAMVAPVSAQQGNSDAAHLCKKGGFQEIRGEDGVRFTNQQECMTYAAQGGTVIEVPDFFITAGYTGWDGYVHGTGFASGSTVDVSTTYLGKEYFLAPALVDPTGAFATTIKDGIGWCVEALPAGPTTTLTAYDSAGVVLYSEIIDLTVHCSNGPTAPVPDLFLTGGLTGWDGWIHGQSFDPGTLVSVSYTYADSEWFLEPTIVSTKGTFSVTQKTGLGWCVDADPTTILTAYDSNGSVIHSETVDLVLYCS